MRYLIIRVKVHTPLTPMSDMISKVVSCLTMASLHFKENEKSICRSEHLYRVLRVCMLTWCCTTATAKVFV